MKQNFWVDFDVDWLRRKIRVFCAENDLSQYKFAELAEISASAATLVLQGKKMPSPKLLALLGYTWRIVPIGVKKGDK